MNELSRLFMFEKPLGMRDTLPNLYMMKEEVRVTMANEMKRWGYQFIETPTLEYYETVGTASAILDTQLFKLLDHEGHTLVLRPDMTAPIARVAASKLLKEKLPQRLAYSANVFRAQQREGGRPAEFEQIGVECIGDPTVSADGECLGLISSALMKTGLEQFQISVGHIAFVRSFFQEILGTDERVEQLMRFLYEKNYVGYRVHVDQLSLSSIDKQRLKQFLKLRGGPEVIKEAEDLLECNAGIEALNELKTLWGIIADYQQDALIKLDLTLVSHMSYYTGIVYEVYAGNVGFPIGSGGRYDLLLEKFGKAKSATGFAIRLDHLLESLDKPFEQPPLSCIVFSLERRKEAFMLAEQQRLEGKKVVLQDINGVEDIDACSALYEDITYLVGKQKEGSR